MKKLGKFKDDQYPSSKIIQKRKTVRCLLQDKDSRYIFLHITGNDVFGIRNHIETIGGGIEEGESMEQALTRECMEEAGCTIKNIQPIGIITDEYNLLQRQTESFFFYAEVKKWNNVPQLTEREKQFGMELVSLSLEEALIELNPNEKIMVEKLVNQRDYLALVSMIKQIYN